MIAIDPDNRLFYEGATHYGHAVWPSPMVSIATIIFGTDDWAKIPAGGDLRYAKLVFREDSFDPVTRIRRGRFYVGLDMSPQEWHVQPHPAYANEEVNRRDVNGNITKRLCGFQIWNVDPRNRTSFSKTVVALGIADARTLWNVVGIERISTGEDLITLRSRSSLGTLPEVRVEVIPEEGRDLVIERLDKVADAAYRAGPESIVDRCRDVTQAMLGAWLADKLGNPKLRTEDVGDLLRRMQADEVLKANTVLISAANIVARLHARAKPNEQVKRGGRPLNEADGECGLALVGTLMRELGWAAE